ncbi:MAG: hypothetical protein EGQ14_02135 [Spirochaetia bacterium]|uniref:hypothetical protein n=2 Tax=Candidatus Avelusimicrobium fimicolum TaxID=3416216 RepID=UPI003CA10673|nr:hypothetical protein [Spirochaetia bacterium]
MKKLFILLVVFFATCINTYASNHSAGKNSDAEYSSCNIQTMLTDPKSTQWFRPQCVRILATRVERGNMSQNEKEQLKKVLVPAFYNIMEQYVYLTGDRAKEESPYFMALYKSLTQLADAKGTYGLVRSDGFMFLEKGKKVEVRSTQAEIVGKKPAVFNFGKLTGDVLNKKVELKLAQKEEDPFWGKKRAPGELTKGLSDGKDGGIVPAFDVSHLESVFLFEQDSKLEEKDFVFDVQILNNMLKERRDFRPLLTFMAENASFNKKHINYIPPRFVRLVLAYYAESLFPAEQTKLMDYVTNPKYSKPFRFLAATVAAAYAYNDDYKDFYEGKFSYYPQEAVAILEVLRTVKTDNPKETVRLELLGNRVFRYVKGQLLLPVEKNKKTEWLEKAALGRALDKTISSAEFISVASASAPETLLTAGGILVIGGAVYGAIYTVSDALSPMYRAQFHDLLDRLTSVEVPETYVPEDLKAKYPIVNGKIRVPVKEGFAQTLPPSSLQGEVYENIELDELGERAAVQNFIVWSEAYYTKIGEDARSVSRTSNKKNITCVYAYTPPGSPWQLNQLSAVANPGDTLSKVRLQKLYQCMSGTSYCKGQTKRTARKNKNSKGKIDFSECAAVDLDKIQAPPECQKDFKELAAAWKVSRSFQEPSGLRLYTRAIYRPLYGGWGPEAEISIKTLDGLHKVLAQWIYDQIFDKFSILIKSEKPLSLGRNAFYRNGAHEWSRWYDENLQSVSRDNSTYQHFHYEEMKTYQNNKNYVCNHVIFVHK